MIIGTEVPRIDRTTAGNRNERVNSALVVLTMEIERLQYNETYLPVSLQSSSMAGSQQEVCERLL